MQLYTIYVYFIILIKVLFIICALTHIFLKATNKNPDLDKTVVYWKERFEFIFFILMAFLLIYLFNLKDPRPVVVEGETKLLLYLFGFILIITAKWSTFIKEAKWFDN